MPRTENSLAAYLDQISRFALLDADQEMRLGVRALRGDTAARRRLVECNLRLVVAVARRYEGHGLDLLDLVQEGNLGLMAAAERFDPRRGARFATFARIWIRQAVCRALSAHSRVVRVPLRLAASQEFRSGERRTLSLAEPAGRDGRALEELLDDRGAGDPAQADARDDASVVQKACASLPGRRRRVVEMRFGLDGRGERTLLQVADELGISRERARRLQERSLYELATRTELRMLRAA
jgi:RNA polymerase sigma factor (sigma-70 family)